MNGKKSLTTVALAAFLLAASPIAQAQNTAAWQGQDSEFGSIRAPYAIDMDGDRVEIESRVVLRQNYEEQDSRFFMFAFTVENQPALDVTFDHLIRTDTGEEMPCYQREGDAKSAIKCFVDLKDMPPAGTEVQMLGTVGANRVGSFQAGALVVPFTYTWARVQQTNGLNAELYAGTIINVNTPSEANGKGVISGDGNLPVPGVGALGVATAAAVAVGIAATTRRRRRG